MKKWFEIINEKVYQGMLGVEEVFSDEDFQEWLFKQPDRILKKTIEEIYKLYKKETKK